MSDYVNFDRSLWNVDILHRWITGKENTSSNRLSTRFILCSVLLCKSSLQHSKSSELDSELREPSRTDEVLPCYHLHLTGEEKKTQEKPVIPHKGIRT